MSLKQLREEEERRLKKLRAALRKAVEAALDPAERLRRLRGISDEEWREAESEESGAS